MLGVLDAHYSAERIRVPVHLLSRLRARCFFAILRPKRPHESRPANPSASKAAIHAICTRARVRVPVYARARPISSVRSSWRAIFQLIACMIQLTRAARIFTENYRMFTRSCKCM